MKQHVIWRLACGVAFFGLLVGSAPAHAKSCGDKQCHKRIFVGEVVHGPVAAGKCTGCHAAKGAVSDSGHKPNAFSTTRSNDACLSCHSDVAKMLRAGKVHQPVQQGSCAKCHLPHSSKHKSLLRYPTAGELCQSCHQDEVKKLKKLSFVHGPVAAGACSFCHSPHASNNEHLLAKTGKELCLGCHDTSRFQTKFKHKALDKGCTSCHHPHGSNQKYFVRSKTNELCGQCHQKIIKLATTAKYKHEVIAKTGCGGCHDPHGSKHAHLMRADGSQTCATCHKAIIAGANKHGPVAEGDCGACHQPHGGDKPRMLNQPFPAEFYGTFSEKRYALCFECHESDVTKVEFTTTLTGFRDGKRNLHYVHVVSPGHRKDKGRSCKACHEVHTGPQAKHVRAEVPFGNGGWKLPIKFTKRKDGGTCVVGCHAPKTYRRSQ